MNRDTVSADLTLIKELARSICNLTGANDRYQVDSVNFSAVANPSSSSSSSNVPMENVTESVQTTEHIVKSAEDAKNDEQIDTITTKKRRMATRVIQVNANESMDITADSTTTEVITKRRRIPTRAMVLNAIQTLNEPDGSSLRKIKRFIYSNYNVNSGHIDIFIRKYLKRAYLRGELIQKKRKPFNISRKFRISPNLSE